MASTATMEAVVLDGRTKQLTYEANYPVPALRGPDDVLVRVAYAGVCGTDLHVIANEFPSASDRRFPMGHEFAGTIHAAGAHCTLPVGTRVVVDPNRGCGTCDYCRKGTYHLCTIPGGKKSTVGIWTDGGWARFVCVPRDQVYAIPDGLTMEQAGLCEPLSCVVHGFERAAPLTVDQRVLVVGAGIIGNLWVASLFHHGFRDVTVSEMNSSRLKIVENLETGYRLVSPDVLDKEQPAFDVIVDCTGVGKVMEINLNYLRAGGKYLLFGACPATHKVTLSPLLLFSKELSLLGVRMAPFSFRTAIAWLNSMDKRFLSYSRLGVKVFALSQYEEALRELRAGTISKAMFKMQQD